MKTLGILGCTGSVGRAAVNLLEKDLKNFSVEILTCNNNIKTLVNQIKNLKPRYVFVKNNLLLKELKNELGEYTPNILTSEEELTSYLENCKLDVCLVAINGLAALKPTLAAIRGCRRICLANKESIVSGWRFISSLAIKYGTEIIPVDSEHNSIFRLLQAVNKPKKDVKNITITASGGALLDISKENLSKVSVEQVLRHPNWNMGAKITVDSATMANKSLELIEACRLFDLKEKEVNVVIHRQSIVHGLINLQDGASLAFLSLPDMQVHINHAILHPLIGNITGYNNLELEELGYLQFEKIDYERFALLKVARQISNNEILCTIFNAANEMAVELFLNKQIAFTKITDIVLDSLEKEQNDRAESVEDIINLHEEVKNKINKTAGICP